jgi:hypothetical protein
MQEWLDQQQREKEAEQKKQVEIKRQQLVALQK